VAFASGDIAFCAEPASARVAAVLGVAEGAALFVTERITRGPALPITFVRLSHLPGYRMHTSLQGSLSRGVAERAGK
jgi:GntR family histidine utilization transcriptional repressor